MNHRILAYHRVSDKPARGLETWSVPPAVFRRQMRLLHRMGYRGVSVTKMLDALDAGNTEEKIVGLSFDDGYLDTVEEAFPILNEFGFTASVYVVPTAIGGETSWEKAGVSSALADWHELRELVDGGWEIGMHSGTHPARFDLLTGEELELEIGEGLNLIEELLETRVETFAFPHGHYSREAIAMLEEAGYRAALTRDPGPVTESRARFELPRYEIKRRDTLIEFAMAMLTGIQLRRRATLLRFSPAGLRGTVRDTEPRPAPPIFNHVENRTKDAA